jgi:Zn-dependent protease with chaperone function
VGLLTMWTLSPYREYVADRGAAAITGAPENLMSAPQKIAGKPTRLAELSRQPGKAA